jgi:hypothetical protein
MLIAQRVVTFSGDLSADWKGTASKESQQAHRLEVLHYGSNGSLWLDVAEAQVPA